MRIKAVDWLVVHCAATRADMDIGVREIRRFHMQKGWSDVGYHYVIRRDGTLEKGRTDTTAGAHAGGYNQYSLGICLVGGTVMAGPKETPSAEVWYAEYAARAKAENNFTDAQFVSLRKILITLRGKNPDAEILGHRDLPGVAKACPSFDLPAYLEENPLEQTTTEAPVRHGFTPRLYGHPGQHRR